MPEERRVQESPIKASPKAKRALKRIAETFHVRQIDALDWAVEALDAYQVHHGGRLLLPLRFTETFQVQTIGAKPPTLLYEPPAPPKSGGRAGLGKTYKGSRPRV